MAELAALLRRFHDRVTTGAPEGDDAGRDGLIASGNLGIYAAMYASRLHDALADDYPKLRAALGDERFGAIAVDYLRARPPRSFTLRDYGIALADRLTGSELAPPWAAELAALERARVEVFDGPDATPLAHADAVALGEQLPALRLTWVPSSALVPLTWAVDDLWSALEDGEPAFEPARAPRSVLVWRRDISVLHRTLDPDEAELAPLIARGLSFADACELLGRLHGDAAGARATELLIRWMAGEALARTDRSA